MARHWNSRIDRQLQGNAGALWIKIGGVDLAAMLFHNAIAYAQPQTGSPSHRLGGEEWIKGPIYIAETVTVVVKQHGDTLVAAAGINTDFFLWITVQSINGVIQQVQQDLFELVFVHGHGRQVGLNVYLDLNIMVTQVVLAQRQHVLQQR